jgi:hypothetical protein
MTCQPQQPELTYTYKQPVFKSFYLKEAVLSAQITINTKATYKMVKV